MPAPYKITPVWDQDSLPAGIKSRHSTKAGVWGLLRVLDGEVSLVFEDGAVVVVTPDEPGLIAPQQLHHVEAARPFRMQVEFYTEPPLA